jgi:CO/xanthine dehydrogenase FAD-binding subunit
MKTEGAESRLARHRFAIAAAAAQVTLADAAIADSPVCRSGVADVPFRCFEPERVLLGTRADPAALRRAVTEAFQRAAA